MEYFDSTLDQNPQLGKHRQPILQLAQGDSIAFQTTLTCADGTPAIPDNSLARVALADRRLHCRIWEGTWRKGVCPVGQEGLVEIKVPDTVSSRLREGSYTVTVSLSSKAPNSWSITLPAYYMLISCQPTSPVSEAPYSLDTPGTLGEPISS